MAVLSQPRHQTGARARHDLLPGVPKIEWGLHTRMGRRVHTRPVADSASTVDGQSPGLSPRDVIELRGPNESNRRGHSAVVHAGARCPWAAPMVARAVAGLATLSSDLRPGAA